MLLPPLLGSIVSIGALRWIDPPTSAFMLRERWLTGSPVAHAWRDWDDIAAPMKLAAIAAEDQRFPAHFGFDVKEIAASLDEARDGGRLRGASTITQQVAKNLLLWPGQDWVRKVLEAYFTALIELCWPKRRILEIYLNVAELGDGIYGVEAAANAYYRKSAAHLGAPESALLAAVLPNPKRLRVEAPSAYVRDRQAWILAQMKRLGPGYVAAL